MYAFFRQHRHADESLFKLWHDVIPVIRQCSELEIRRNSIQRPGFGFGFEKPDQQFSGILLIICAFILNPQHRKVAGKALNCLGQHIEMLAGLQRHVDASHQANVTTPHPSAIDHKIRLHRPFVGGDPDCPPACLLNAGYGHTLKNLDACVARAFGQCQRDIGRITLRVLRRPQAARHACNIQQRIFVPAFRCGQNMRLDSKDFGEGRLPPELFEAVVRQGDAERPFAAIAGGKAGLRFQAGVEIAGILGEQRHVERRAQMRQQACGMPGGAAGQAFALQQDNVAPAKLAKMIGDRTADNTTADDDDAGLGRDVDGHFWCPASQSIR